MPNFERDLLTVCGVGAIFFDLVLNVGGSLRILAFVVENIGLEII